MAEEGKKIGASLVHYSTDYVFDGTKGHHILKRSAQPAERLWQNEICRRASHSTSGIPHLIFRTAWVYSTPGRNFLLTVLRLATQRDELRIVRDQLGTPTRNLEIAASTTAILAQIAKSSESSVDLSVGGTYHMTAGGVTTWYDFARAILEDASLAPKTLSWLACALDGHPLRESRVVPITTEEYPTPAHRPAYSVLSNALLAKTFRVELPDWRIQLHRTFGEESSAVT